jgi:hypothetical protein
MQALHGATATTTLGGFTVYPRVPVPSVPPAAAYLHGGLELLERLARGEGLQHPSATRRGGRPRRAVHAQPHAPQGKGTAAQDLHGGGGAGGRGGPLSRGFWGDKPHFYGVRSLSQPHQRDITCFRCHRPRHLDRRIYKTGAATFQVCSAQPTWTMGVAASSSEGCEHRSSRPSKPAPLSRMMDGRVRMRRRPSGLKPKTFTAKTYETFGEDTNAEGKLSGGLQVEGEDTVGDH